MEYHSNNIEKAKEKKKEKDLAVVIADIIGDLKTNAFISMIIGFGIGSFRCLFPGNNASTFFRSIAITTFIGTFWFITVPSAGCYYVYKAIKNN